MGLINYLSLPREITPFEHRYLGRLNKVALVVLYLHIPVLMGVAWAAGTGPLNALGLSLAVLVGPTIAYRSGISPRAVSVIYGMTTMLLGGLLVHFGQGPVQIEMHFYFFAMLAMLSMFANPMVNVAAAATVALHHLIVWLLLPQSVFNYEAQWWVVLVHASFVIFETIAACFISRQFFDNVVGLEKIVEARTATINEKQRDMRLILDTVGEGLVTIDFDGKLTGESSKAVQEWFGKPTSGTQFSAWLGAHDAAFGSWFDLALESVREGFLPRDITIAQLPTSVKDGDRRYSVSYQLISAAAAATPAPAVEHRTVERPRAVSTEPDKLLVVITDITERLRKAEAERHQAELLALFQHISRDKAGFIEFLTEAEEIVHSLQERRWDDLDHLKRIVHTLKGNAGLFGLRRLAEICHGIENRIAEDGEEPSSSEITAIHGAWDQMRAEVQAMLGETGAGLVEIDDAEYEAILRAVLDGVDHRLVARMLASWRLEPAAKRLTRVRQQIAGLADRVGKSHIDVVVEPNDVRFDSERFASFWSSFIHVLRNTVDHGVEAPEQRVAAGKPERAKIALSTSVRGDQFTVTVHDDGPGVNWEALRRSARNRGLPEVPASEQHKLIFAAGVSSRTEVSDISGRGVGMSAVAESCEALGGTIEVESWDGQGTRIRFNFPSGDAVYHGHAIELARTRNITTAAA
jgi:two-component system, chemotaxis family, sensor kinase CheA